jgi:hypothetical protein
MKERIEELAREHGVWAISGAIIPPSRTFNSYIERFAQAIHNEALEMAAMKIAPEQPRPCSCDICDCGNSGDLRAVAYWDECNANAEAIRKLKV